MTREYDRSLGAGAEIAWLTPGRGEVPRLGTANIHLVSSLGTGYWVHAKPQSTVTVKIQCKANIFNLAYISGQLPYSTVLPSVQLATGATAVVTAAAWAGW